VTETKRIRWTDDLGRITGFTGCVGTCGAWLFQVWKADDGWILEARLPGAGGRRISSDNPDDLKAEAEGWLAGFVASLGAVFPDEPAKQRKSRAWHADWAEVDRDSSGNAILRHKPTGGRYKILPVEEC
jgi:hypothetical protein